MARITTMMVIGNHPSCACIPVPSVMTTMAIYAGTAMSTAQTGSVFISNFIQWWAWCPAKLNQYVEAIVKWINLLANLTLEIEILINLWAEAHYSAMRGEGDDVGRRRENRASHHVTVFCTTPDLWPRLDTLVPRDCVSTVWLAPLLNLDETDCRRRHPWPC